MKLPDLRKMHAELGHLPIVTGLVGGAQPLYVERYLYQTSGTSVSALRSTVMATQFGGGRISEVEQSHFDILPTQSFLLPPRLSTRWTYAGSADFALFHFLDEETGCAGQLSRLASARGAPFLFNDSLVGAVALQLVDEVQRGAAADQDYMGRLAQIMLEQAYRKLTTPGPRGINPRYVHFQRLQAVLNFIQQHLMDELSVEVLAAQAGVSLTHFRRIFQEAMGLPPHRYILSLRLEQSRKWLSTSAMPIQRIAEECGFKSQSHFTACFRAAHAVTPAAFRAQTRRQATPSV